MYTFFANELAVWLGLGVRVRLGLKWLGFAVRVELQIGIKLTV